MFKALLLVLTIASSQVNAGTITLEHLNFNDYFSSHEGRWSGKVRASSSVQWPNWMQYQGFLDFEDVLESGLMAYRCNDAVSGGCTASDPDTHRFIFIGKATPKYPLLGINVVVNDKVVAPGVFQRTWGIVSVEDAIQTTAHFPFIEFTPPIDGVALLPVGFKVILHLSDIDTIEAMLAGNFGSPLAHRSSQPCTALREVNGVVFSTQCKL